METKKLLTTVLAAAFTFVLFIGIVFYFISADDRKSITSAINDAGVSLVLCGVILWLFGQVLKLF